METEEEKSGKRNSKKIIADSHLLLAAPERQESLLTNSFSASERQREVSGDRDDLSCHSSCLPLVKLLVKSYQITTIHAPFLFRKHNILHKLLVTLGC